MKKKKSITQQLQGNYLVLRTTMLTTTQKKKKKKFNVLSLSESCYKTKKVEGKLFNFARNKNGVKSSFRPWPCKNSVLPFQGHHHNWHGPLHWCLWPLQYPFDYDVHRTNLLREAWVCDPTCGCVHHGGHRSSGYCDWSAGVW